MKKILILEDEMSIREYLVINFKRAGFDVVAAATGNDAINLYNENPDIKVAVLDVMLPDINGFEVCRKIREKSKTVGIIMLSAKDMDEDVLSGFISGADDYMKKPVSTTILLAKVEALYRRIERASESPQSSAVVSAPEEIKEEKIFEVNENTKTITKRKIRLNLSPVEFKILKYFIANPNRIITREELLKNIWGENFTTDSDIVNVNIRRLRLKIEDDPNSPMFLQTEWSVGYKWVCED
ncbi:MAG: response regulator transcription factor [Ruminococcus sp.]|nr:response regulator transcription factor [Ruminococcus sp.]